MRPERVRKNEDGRGDPNSSSDNHLMGHGAERAEKMTFCLGYWACKQTGSVPADCPSRARDDEKQRREVKGKIADEKSTLRVTGRWMESKKRTFGMEDRTGPSARTVSQPGAAMRSPVHGDGAGLRLRRVQDHKQSQEEN